ncbi:hypothetical protein [Rufibacter quisquiliarum]|uniref:Uncharacterized protein n=1 Tax=Rufibacter quisquiliarum TaxID=1549639 RepID=A0A839GGZ9_9BACT|nr:hypothetical protein [Rufibacter quisquiliarum]MBA9077850.1 hypothetical protein [Rufibacter quisquiliarum]
MILQAKKGSGGSSIAFFEQHTPRYGARKRQSQVLLIPVCSAKDKFKHALKAILDLEDTSILDVSPKNRSSDERKGMRAKIR